MPATTYNQRFAYASRLRPFHPHNPYLQPVSTSQPAGEIFGKVVLFVTYAIS